MFKISEFSHLVRISPRMLRHYEKFGLLYPAEIHKFTGYRQCGAGQIPLAQPCALPAPLTAATMRLGRSWPGGWRTTATALQALSVGMLSHDNEPETVLAMERFVQENGYEIDITPVRYHHEIYLTGPRKTAPAKLKTVIRHPIKQV